MKRWISLLLLAGAVGSGYAQPFDTYTNAKGRYADTCTNAKDRYVDTLANCLRMHNDSAAVYIYHGVPYAHAERFRAPVLVDGMDGNGVYILDNTVCYQRTEKADSTKQYGESHVVLEDGEASPCTEQCLVLTVNSPYPLDAAPAADLPVLVYIHGGNYFAGGGERTQTQLAEFALREQVVTVTVTYRLGIFGYFYQPDSQSVNLGLQDQLTALRWVNENIVRFGGDSANITLAGQSAGAQSVVYCLADTARVRIDKAVVFSAPMGLTTSASLGKQRTRYVRRHADCDLWTCPADTLLAAQLHYMDTHKQAWHSLPFSPTALPQMPKYGDRVQWPRRVVVCAQKDDGSMFGPKALWPMLTSVVFTAPAKRYVRYLEKQGVETTYQLFTWAPHGSPLAAAHCAELPLLLDGTDEFWIGSWIMGDVTAEELAPRRAYFKDCMATFMRTGVWQYNSVN